MCAQVVHTYSERMSYRPWKRVFVYDRGQCGTANDILALSSDQAIMTIDIAPGTFTAFCTFLLWAVCGSSSSSSSNEYYLGGVIALLLQDHRTMSTESVCSSQYMMTDQHWATGVQMKHFNHFRTIQTIAENVYVWRVGPRRPVSER